MRNRAGIYAAVAGTVGLFLCIQLGALALVEPFVAADYQPVEDPSDPTNSLVFFGGILVATGVVLAAIKFGRERIIRLGIVLASGVIGWYVFGALAAPLAGVETGAAAVDSGIAALSVLIPLLAGAAIVAGLVFHPEWYVLDAAGVVLGAGAAGLFGTAFGPLPAILFLVLLAVYDAISVYGTEHMLDLAEGVANMRVPALLVIPTSRSFSILGEDGSPTPETLEDDAATPGGAPDEGTAATTPGDASERDSATSVETDEAADADEAGVRDAIYIGLGDAVMPSILVASAAVFLGDAAPSLGVPGLALTLPALTAMAGTTAGLLVLLWLVLKGRPHAGLPLLNGGTILGYLLGALASGLTLAEAVGLPL